MPPGFISSSKEIELQKALLQTCREIAETPIEQLTQVSRFGQEGGFESLRPMFEKTILLFDQLSKANLDLASEARLDGLSRITSKLQQTIQNIRAFSLGSSPVQRDNLMLNFKTAYDDACDEIGRFIGLSFLSSRSEEAQRRLITQLRDLNDSAQKEISDTLKTVRDVAKKAGISEHAYLFKDEAREHQTAARKWLVVTIVLFLGTSALAVVNYSKTLSTLSTIIAPATSKAAPQSDGVPQTTGLTVQLTIAKLIVFSLLFSAVLWAGRIYRAHRHNYVINKHRQNALSTFEVFVRAASADEQTKNAVLLQATQCIFSAQNTGYLGQPDKDSEGQPQILEIWRSLSPKG